MVNDQVDKCVTILSFDNELHKLTSFLSVCSCVFHVDGGDDV